MIRQLISPVRAALACIAAAMLLGAPLAHLAQARPVDAQLDSVSLGTLTALAGAALQAGDVDGVGANARFTAPSGVSISADGSFALLVEEGSSKLKRVELATAQVSTLLATLPGAFAVDLSRDGSFALVTTGARATVQRVALPSGIVSTLAGKDRTIGTADGIGAAARFAYLTSVAISADGGLALVTDADNQTIRAIDLASGQVTTIAGLAGRAGAQDGMGGAARFRVPSGIALSADGGIALIADRNNATIRRLDLASGMVTTIAGKAGTTGYSDGAGAAARFVEPNAIALSPDDSYALISDRAAHTLRRLDLATGGVTTLLGRAGSAGSAPGVGGAARLNFPRGIDISPDSGFGLVADVSNQTVSLLSATIGADEEVATLAGAAGLPGASDGAGSLARFNRPVGVATSDGGLVAIADADNHTIRQATIRSRVISTLAGAAGQPGSADGALAAARFREPLGVGISRDGNTILVADTGNHTIRTINIAAGTVRTLAGTAGSPGQAEGSGAAARFDSPYDVELSGDGSFALVADTGNHTIRRIDLASGAVSTLAGQADTPGNTDGTGPAARFNQPVGISISRDGSFALVADQGNGAIRKLVLVTGAVTTLRSGVATRRLPAQSGPALAGERDSPIFNVVLPCAQGSALVSNGAEQRIGLLDLATGALEPLLGKLYTPGAVDGVGEAARFNGPSALAASCYDGGSVVVSDTGNQTVRQIGTDLLARVYLPQIRGAAR